MARRRRKASGPVPRPERGRRFRWLGPLLAILCVGALLAVLLPVLWTWRDLAGAPEQRTEGVIVRVVTPRAYNRFGPRISYLTVRLDDGRKLEAATYLSRYLLYERERALISYRVGRSGRVYVDEVTLLDR